MSPSVWVTVKDLNGYETSQTLPSKCKVYVRVFPVTKMRCMKDYLKPPLREKPDRFIFNVGTNDLNSERQPQPITKSIPDLAASLKSRTKMLVLQILLHPLINKS